MQLAARITILSVFASPAFAADHIVGLPGSGAPFTSIQAAIDGAQNGDRVLVGAGIYEQTVLLQKPIELIGGIGGPSVIKGTNPAPQPSPTPLVVRDLPAGARARVSNFSIHPLPHSLYSPPASALGVYDCAGRVELTQLQLVVSTANGYALGSSIAFLDIRDCAQVYAAHVDTPPQAPFAVKLLGQGHHGAYVENSSVAFHHCHLQGELRTWGGAGLRAANSSIEVSQCVLSGGQAYGFATTAGEGGPGVELASSSLRVSGGSDSVLRGADAIDQAILFTYALGLAASALEGDAASLVVYGAEVVPDGGAGTQVYPPAPAIAAGIGSVTALPRRLPMLAFEPALGPLGAPLVLRLEGEPNAIHVRYLSLATGPAIQLPGIGGTILLDAAAFAILGATVLDASGVALLNSAVPSDPAFAGIQVLAQALQVLPGALDLSLPGQLLVSP
jgi:hypothetical protein